MILDTKKNSPEKIHTPAPIGAGDLIDRAVRFYRNNFWTFVWIAAPPVLLGTLFSIGWTVLGRELLSTGALRSTDDIVLSQLFTWFGNSIIWLMEIIAALCIMGGASRNFVRHILFGEAITFRETYKNTFKRLGGLLIASLLIFFILSFCGTTIFYLGIIVAGLGIAAAVYVLQFSTFLMLIVSALILFAVLLATGWLFFLVASRFAYVPQVMLVEGQGVFSAIGRSTSLAGANVRRLYALFVFTTFATYSALALLYVPLSFYAAVNGIEFYSFDPDVIPAWYVIANQVISQASLILLLPILMIGLCILYVDERVRHEGYDIELMAAQRLGEIPVLPAEYVNPLHPALAVGNTAPAVESPKPPFTTLGLN